MQRLVRGTHAIDDRLDLHGLTQEAAKRRLMDFLHRAQADGLKTVLVITGKGALGTDRFEAGDFTAERGVLRRVVPEWLRMPGARGLVVGFSEAHAAHGGSGALYVRIRRPKTGR
ncbi:Smr/MutS family protein [Segnochrobactrum spirostomi]|uniref:Smr/MutS family protein n=1 Tax=Segnochrobactrum spirostomi TaxID=2608987 RepID=UPI0028B08A1F|nr:Smr/MutS family protein [Segnochrobactrum spirostomi]